MNKKCVEYMTLSLKLFEDHMEIEVSEKELARPLVKLMECDPEHILKIFQDAATELDAYIMSSDCIERIPVFGFYPASGRKRASRENPPILPGNRAKPSQVVQMLKERGALD